MKTDLMLKNAAGLLIIIAFFSGCKCKEKDDKETQSASDFEQGQQISEDISNMADAAAFGAVKFKTKPGFSIDDELLSTCANVTRDTLNGADPDTIIIDFGTSNCLCADNRNRRGIITIIHFGDKFTSGSYRSIFFSNFFVNDNKIEGTHTITANGKNGSGNWNWTVTGQNMKITNAKGKFHTWNSARLRELIEGGSTLYYRDDDVLKITGSASGNNSNGKNYSATIISPIIKEAGCQWIVKGTVQIVPDNKPMRTLDFGTGSCDNKATVTIDGNIYNITLN